VIWDGTVSEALEDERKRVVPEFKKLILLGEE